MRPPLLVTHDPVLAEVFARLAAAAGADLEVVVDAVAARPAWRTAPLVVVGIDAADGVLAEGLPRRDGVVLAAAEPADPELWRRAVAVGAEHVALLPEAESWVVDKLRDTSRGPLPRGPVIGLVGGRGGGGATTLACALAVTAARAGHDAVLVDADPLGGGIDLALGVEARPPAVWPDATGAQPWPTVAGLTVLSWNRDRPATIPPERLAAVLDTVRRTAGVVVVDVGRSLDASARAAFAALTGLLVVVPAEVRACAAAARLAEAVSAYVGDSRVVVRGPSPARLAAAQVAAAVGLPLAAWLPAEPGLALALERGDAPARHGRGPLARVSRELLASYLPESA